MVNFVILCGGSGSRLWPKSREKLPKQLLSLTNEFTMLQNTISRFLLLDSKMSCSEVSTNEIIIISNQDHCSIIETQVKEMKNLKMKYRIISEPKGRDSAPAICISALLGLPETYTFVVPCDHAMDEEEFANVCLSSLDYLHDSVVTFGIQPTHPETGYGYIQCNEKKETIKFIEKPTLEKAKQYVQEKTYWWNAGIFAFKN